MKKIIITLTLSLLIPVTVLALDDCPLGKTDSSCKYPGECENYIDTDDNEICDHSQLALEDKTIEAEKEIHDLITDKELKTKTVEEVAQIYKINLMEYSESLSEFYKATIKPSHSFQVLHDNYEVEPSTAKKIATSIKNGQKIEITRPKSVKNRKAYHLLPILFILTLLYFITLSLSKRKTISSLTHKKIWNVFLLITFLASGVLGILLIIKINFGIVFPLFFNILFWHVEIGIAMFIICVFHIIERWYFFRNIFRKKTYLNE